MSLSRPLLLTCLTALAVGCDDGASPGGDAGIGAPSTISRVQAQTAGCPNGGFELQYGIDDNGNGVLDDAEVDGANPVCNGEDGAPGERGEPGPQGEQGEQGEQGPAGPAGEAGPAGPQGAPGADGAPGAMGPAGPQGEQGPMGPAGAAGPQGAQGPAGPQGEQGVAGPQGEQGVAGPQGEQGPAGPQGEQGPAGPQGEQGPAGPQGEQGVAGPQGEQGVAGPQGEQGVAGPQGEQGPQGERGVDGSSCTVSEDGAGTATIECTDGSSIAFAIPFCGNGIVEAGEVCDGVEGCLPTCTLVCPGVIVGDFCWFIGANNESCTTVCANQGLAYSEGTRTYAGSDGTNENCLAVMRALEAAGEPVPPSPNGVFPNEAFGGGRGCVGFDGSDVQGYGWIRDSAATTADARQNISRRACACE